MVQTADDHARQNASGAMVCRLAHCDNREGRSSYCSSVDRTTDSQTAVMFGHRTLRLDKVAAIDHLSGKQTQLENTSAEKRLLSE